MTPVPWTMSRVSMLHIRPPATEALSLAFIIMERKQLRKTDIIRAVLVSLNWQVRIRNRSSHSCFEALRSQSNSTLSGLGQAPKLRNRSSHSCFEALRSQRVSRWWPVTSDDGEWPLGTRGLHDITWHYMTLHDHWVNSENATNI